MARIDPDHAPYKVSRAALREAHGARAITYGGQSTNDSTPSGRAKYISEQTGKPLSLAEDQQAQEFGAKFPFRNDQPLSRAVIQNPVAAEPLPFNQGGLASPEDIGRVRARGASYGAFQTPYGPASFGTPPDPLGLVPETGPAEAMSEFLPTTTSPLNNFALPKIPKTFLGQSLPGASRFG